MRKLIIPMLTACALAVPAATAAPMKGKPGGTKPCHGKAKVITSMADLADWQPTRRVALISQSTSNVEKFIALAKDLVADMVARGVEVRVINTICKPTKERQSPVHCLKSSASVPACETSRKAQAGRLRYIASPGNLLYKTIPVSAASHCEEIGWRLFVALNRFFGRGRSGPGKQTGRSAAQAGHDAAE